MSKYLNVICYFLYWSHNFMDTGWIFCCYVTMLSSCCLSAVEKVFLWLSGRALRCGFNSQGTHTLDKKKKSLWIKA